MAFPGLKCTFSEGQKALVHFLEKKEQRLSRAQKKFYLFLFVFFFGGFFLCSLVAGLAGQGSSAIRISPMKRPTMAPQQQLKNDTIKFKNRWKHPFYNPPTF